MAAVACSLLATPAHAIGMCEDLEFTSTLVAYASDRALFLYEGTQELCSDEDDTRVTLPYLRATTLDGEDVAFFYTPNTRAAWPDQEELDDFEQSAGKLPTQPDALGAPHVASSDVADAFRKEAGFVPVTALGPSPQSGCAIRALPAQEAIPEDEATYNGFPAADMQVVVQINGNTVAQKRHTNVSTEHGELSATPIFTRDRQTLLVLTSTPRCEGGPPPGYFGEDDPGDCYLEITTELTRYAVADHPALAACWGPTAPTTGMIPAPEARSGGCASCAIAAPSTPAPLGLIAALAALAGLLIARRRRP